MISQQTIIIIYNRSRMRCEACRKKKGQEFHHIYFKSEYQSKDRDEEWNLAFICRECHQNIHHNTKQGLIYNYHLKRKTYLRTKKQALLPKLNTLEQKVKEIKKANKIIKKYEKTN